MTSINPSQSIQTVSRAASQLPTSRLLFNALMEKNFIEADKYVEPFFLSQWSGDGRTFLHWMVIEGNIEACEYLLNKGMDVNIRSRPTLNDPELNGWNDAHKKMYEEDVKRNGNGFTPLHYAIFKKNEALITFLCANGANPNLKDIRGFTPFVIAIWKQLNSSIINTLINAGVAELDPIIQQGNVSAYLSEQLLKSKGNAQMRTLLALNIDIGKPGIRGLTLLQLAISIGAEEIIPDLLKMNANVHYIEPENKKTALLLAKLKGYPDRDWMQMLAKQDNGFSDHLHQAQLLAARFGINHFLSAGNYTYSVFPSLIESLSAFEKEAKEEELEICRTVIDDMKRIYENENNPSYFLHRIHNNLPTIIPLRFIKHTYTIGVFDLLMKCDRGLGSQGHSGIKCYKIGNSDLKATVISHLFTIANSDPRFEFNQEELAKRILKHQEDSLYFINADLHSLLRLSLDSSYGQKPQKVGNCWIIAAKQCILLSAYYAYRSRGQKHFQSLISAKRNFYFKWREFDRLFALQKLTNPAFLPFHETFDFENLFGNIFLNAIKGRKFNVIDYLLKEKPELTRYIDPTTGENCLFAAARHFRKRKASLFPMLVTKGANVTLRTQNQSTLLHEAAKYGNSRLVGVLLNTYQLDPKTANNNGDTPLHEAARSGDLDSCYSLHQCGADLNTQNNYGETALFLAACQNSQKTQKKFAVRYLLRNGADPSIASKDGITPLCFIVQNNQRNLCREFLRNGAPIDSNNPKTAPLYVAVNYRCDEAAEILLANGADHKILIDGLNLYEIAQLNSATYMQHLLLKLPFFKELLEARQIFPSIQFLMRGSQHCDSSALDSQTVLDYTIQLNQKSPSKNIIFNSYNKPLYTIEGGTCSAMSLSWVKLLTQSEQPAPELFAKDQAFLASTSEFRNTQAAMNCIEVINCNDFEQAEEKKMLALAAFYDIQLEKYSAAIHLLEIDTLRFSDGILNLKDGIYISRMVERSENAKMENRGHTTILEKRNNHFHYYDPNHGLGTLEATQANADIIAAFIKRTSLHWKTFHQAFYRVIPKT